MLTVSGTAELLRSFDNVLILTHIRPGYQYPLTRNGIPQRIARVMQGSQAPLPVPIVQFNRDQVSPRPLPGQSPCAKKSDPTGSQKHQPNIAGPKGYRRTVECKFQKQPGRSTPRCAAVHAKGHDNEYSQYSSLPLPVPKK